MKLHQSCGKSRLKRKAVWVTGSLLLALLFSIFGCRKFIEVPLPNTESFPDVIFSNDINATGAIIGIYGKMITNNAWASGNTRSVTLLSGLSADELENYSALTIPREFYENSININNTAIETAFWDEAYQYIYAANAALEGLSNPNGVSDGTKMQLEGEALFIRAFCHFYLVNLFGDIPYLTNTDYKTNIVMARTLKDRVYQLIVADLKEAQGKLKETYTAAGGITGRVRPNKFTATAFLARVYLYMANWKEAEIQANAVIEYTTYYGLDSLNGVFLKDSKETIWQLMPNANTGYNTWEGKNFILTLLPTTDESNSVVLGPYLLQAFEPGDLRRIKWVDSIKSDAGGVYYFPYKYKIQNGNELKEYSMVFRLAEQYLIRAEARARLGQIDGAKEDLDIIRQRAGLLGTRANTTTELLIAIAHERQVELFTEWGHRWLDLKRTNRANTILSAEKASTWQATDTLYPIPQKERALNKNLTQNIGY
ncbi:RagB/SusD family nutrient uptake outer membrane protein [Chitinophaga agrisoli]|nr:RagB/SusD family nutrient uptake outer membrane protein [Chitinophaga agrisoli]